MNTHSTKEILSQILRVQLNRLSQPDIAAAVGRPLDFSPEYRRNLAQRLPQAVEILSDKEPSLFPLLLVVPSSMADPRLLMPLIKVNGRPGITKIDSANLQPNSNGDQAPELPYLALGIRLHHCQVKQLNPTYIHVVNCQGFLPANVMEGLSLGLHCPEKILAEGWHIFLPGMVCKKHYPSLRTHRGQAEIITSRGRFEHQRFIMTCDARL